MVPGRPWFSPTPEAGLRTHLSYLGSTARPMRPNPCWSPFLHDQAKLSPLPFFPTAEDQSAALAWVSRLVSLIFLGLRYL